MTVQDATTSVVESVSPEEENASVAFVEALKGRISTYQLLARLFRVEVDQPLYDALCGMQFPANTGNGQVDKGYAMLCSYLSAAHDDVITDLAVDYVRAFIGSGNNGYSAAYPFESVYTSPKRLMMQDARDEVLVLYHAAGLEKQESWKEGEDHLALELEFEQILGARALEAFEAGDEDRCYDCLLQQRNFLEDHLLSWYPMMAEDLEKFPKTDFYKGLGILTSGFLASDLEFLNLVLDEENQESEDGSGSVVEMELELHSAPVEGELSEAERVAMEFRAAAEDLASAAGVAIPSSQEGK